MGRPKGKPKTPEEVERIRQNRIRNSRKWHANNKARDNEYSKEYNRTRRKYRTGEEKREYDAEWRRKRRGAKPPKKVMTPEERVQRRRENEKRIRAENPERFKANKRRYKEKHGDRVRLLDTIYVARRRSLRMQSLGTFTIEDISRMYDQQGRKCANIACRKPISDKTHSPIKFHIDHVLPLTKGGTDDPSNLQLLCKTCNQRKHAKHPDEWAKQNGLLFS